MSDESNTPDPSSSEPIAETRSSPPPRKTPSLLRHASPNVTALSAAGEDRAYSADETGAVLGWERGSADAVASRKGKADRAGRGTYSIPSIGVVKDIVVVREGTASFLALDAGSLEKRAKLPHRGALLAVGVNDEVIVTAGGKTLQAYTPGNWASPIDSIGPGGVIERLQPVPSRKAVVATDGQTVGLFQAADLKPIARRSFADIDRIVDVRPTPSGELFALFFVDRGGRTRLRLWNPASADAVTLDTSMRSATPLQEGIAALVDDDLVLFDYGGAQKQRAPLSQFIEAEAVHIAGTDGRRVAVASGNRLAVLDPWSGRILQRHALDAQFLHVLFAGSQLVCATDAGTVVWLAAEMGA